MIREVTITPISKTRREFIAARRDAKRFVRSAKRLSDALSRSAKYVATPDGDVDVDPVSFARAFDVFRADMQLLAECEQDEFRCTLRKYLAGAVDSEEWRQLVSKLSALRRIAAEAKPHHR